MNNYVYIYIYIYIYGNKIQCKPIFLRVLLLFMSTFIQPWQGKKYVQNTMLSPLWRYFVVFGVTTNLLIWMFLFK